MIQSANHLHDDLNNKFNHSKTLTTKERGKLEKVDISFYTVVVTQPRDFVNSHRTFPELPDASLSSLPVLIFLFLHHASEVKKQKSHNTEGKIHNLSPNTRYFLWSSVHSSKSESELVDV